MGLIKDFLKEEENKQKRVEAAQKAHPAPTPYSWKDELAAYGTAATQLMQDSLRNAKGIANQAFSQQPIVNNPMPQAKPIVQNTQVSQRITNQPVLQSQYSNPFDNGNSALTNEKIIPKNLYNKPQTKPVVQNNVSNTYTPSPATYADVNSFNNMAGTGNNYIADVVSSTPEALINMGWNIRNGLLNLGSGTGSLTSQLGKYAELYANKPKNNLEKAALNTIYAALAGTPAAPVLPLASSTYQVKGKNFQKIGDKLYDLSNKELETSEYLRTRNNPERKQYDSVSALKSGKTALPYILGSVGSQLPNYAAMAAGTALGGVPGGASAGTLMSFLQEGNYLDKLKSFREQYGREPNEQELKSILNNTAIEKGINTALETASDYVGGKFLKGLGLGKNNNPVKNTLKQNLVNLVDSAASEAVTENLQELSSEIAESNSGLLIGNENNTPLQNLANRHKEITAATLLSTLALGGGATAISNINNKQPVQNKGIVLPTANSVVAPNTNIANLNTIREEDIANIAPKIVEKQKNKKAAKQIKQPEINTNIENNIADIAPKTVAKQNKYDNATVQNTLKKQEENIQNGKSENSGIINPHDIIQTEAYKNEIEKIAPNTVAKQNANKTNLTEEQQNKLAELDAEYKKYKSIIEKTEKYEDEKGKKLKGLAMEYAAKKRKVIQGESLEIVDGGLTGKELKARKDRLASNYNGKEVYVNGKKAKIIARPFGRVKVEFEDGTTKVVEKENISTEAPTTEIEQIAPNIANKKNLDNIKLTKEELDYIKTLPIEKQQQVIDAYKSTRANSDYNPFKDAINSQRDAKIQEAKAKQKESMQKYEDSRAKAVEKMQSMSLEEYLNSVGIKARKGTRYELVKYEWEEANKKKIEQLAPNIVAKQKKVKPNTKIRTYIGDTTMANDNYYSDGMYLLKKNKFELTGKNTQTRDLNVSQSNAIWERFSNVEDMNKLEPTGRVWKGKQLTATEYKYTDNNGEEKKLYLPKIYSDLVKGYDLSTGWSGTADSGMPFVKLSENGETVGYVLPMTNNYAIQNIQNNAENFVNVEEQKQKQQEQRNKNKEIAGGRPTIKYIVKTNKNGNQTGMFVETEKYHSNGDSAFLKEFVNADISRVERKGRIEGVDKTLDQYFNAAKDYKIKLDDLGKLAEVRDNKGKLKYKVRLFHATYNGQTIAYKINEKYLLDKKGYELYVQDKDYSKYKDFNNIGDSTISIRKNGKQIGIIMPVVGDYSSLSNVTNVPKMVQDDITSSEVVHKTVEKQNKNIEKSKENTIQDSGEFLLGNRKENTNLTWNDLEEMNEVLRAKNLTKAKIYKKPTLEELQSQGLDKYQSAIVNYVYNSIAAKIPSLYDTEQNKIENQKKYTESLKSVMDKVIETVKNNPEDFKFIDGKDSYYRNNTNLVVNPTNKLLDAIFPDVENKKADNKYANIFRLYPEYNKIAGILGGNKFARALQLSKSDTSDIDKILSKFDETKEKKETAKKEDWEKQFTLLEPDRWDNKWRIGTAKKKNGHYQIVGDGYDTKEEAIEVARKITEIQKKAKEEISKANFERNYIERRENNRDITPDELRESFGFKGVNFGNYVNQKERQQFLNYAYDSLLDLAELLDLPQKAISLNGSLGLAFGAQGRGGKVAGHYIPAYQEINMTKDSGAGTLAHEWFHALDNYFGHQSEGKSFTDSYGTDISEQGELRKEVYDSFKELYDVMKNTPLTEEEIETRKNAIIERAEKNIKYYAQEVKNTFRNVDGVSEFIDNIVANKEKYTNLTLEQEHDIKWKDFAKLIPPKRQTISNMARISWLFQEIARLGKVEELATKNPGKTEYYKNAEKLDSIDTGMGKLYWTKPTELGARAFTTYLLDKMETKQIVNKFLARSQDGEYNLDYKEFAKELKTGENRKSLIYWNPTNPEEKAKIFAAFDKLFNTIKTRETDKGIELYQTGKENEVSGSRTEDVKVYTDIIHDKLSKVLGISKETLDKSLTIKETNEVRYADKNTNVYFQNKNIYNNFVNHHKNNNLIESAPEKYNGNTVEDICQYLGITDKSPAIIKTPIDNIIINKDHIKKLVNLNEKERKGFLNFVIRTLEKPNLIVKDGNKNKYIKLFNEKGETKPHLQIVKVKNDGTFYVTNFRPSKSQVNSTINEGQIIYDLSNVQNEKSSANSNITNFSSKFKYDSDNNPENTNNINEKSNLINLNNNEIIKGSYNPQENIIEFFKGADKSTSTHEVAHYMVETWNKYASESKEIAEDLAALREFSGNTGEPFTPEQHEKIARAFERYIRDGKAATSKLQKAFERFKEALKTIYRSIKDIFYKSKGKNKYFSNKEMNNINEVFNRIFTTAKERADLGIKDKNYVTETPEFKKWSNNAPLVESKDADNYDFKTGEKVVVEAFHGTKRADRVGSVFLPGRATSGPMAMFSSNREISEGYAKNKSDTSISAYEDTSYSKWFKINVNGRKYDLDNAWWNLSSEQRETISKNAPHITNDDMAENIIYDENTNRGLGNYDYVIKKYRGNALKALVDGWLEGGTLYNKEEDFQKVLELAGLNKSDIIFDSPYAEHPGVYDVYIQMQKPLVTNDIPQEVISKLEKEAKKQPIPNERGIGVDFWDKNVQNPNEWISILKEDYKNGENSFAWSSIPDWVTNTLKSFGYDGIIDMGGKSGGEIHKVYIPFASEQIKSVDNKGAFNPNNPDIYYQTGENSKDNKNIEQEIRDTAIELDGIKPIKRSKVEDLKNIVERTITPISTRLEKISPVLKYAIRKFEYNLAKNENNYAIEAQPFLDKLKTMSKEDYKVYDFALKNSNKKQVEYLNKKYGIEKEYLQVRKLLENIRKDAIDVGMDVGLIEDYFPRKITDSKKFLKEISKKTQIEDYLKGFENLSDDDKANKVNNAIRGFNGIITASNSHTKSRKINELTALMNAYYKDSKIALSEYLTGMNKAIQTRKFFGNDKKFVNQLRLKLRNKKAKLKEATDSNEIKILKSEIGKLSNAITKYENGNLEDSIGAYIKELIDNKQVDATDEGEIKDILNSRFNEKSPGAVVTALKNMGYLSTMGNFNSAITQIGDFAWTLYRNGFLDTVAGVKKSFSKNKITKKDLGIDKIAQEFEGDSASSKMVNSVFKLVGLDFIDSLGKETFVNANLKNLQREATEQTDKITKRLNPIFGNETDDVIKDLQNGNVSDNVKFLLFNEISEFQPISNAEMPQNYLTSGNARIFYSLKSYSIKQFDVLRNQIFNQYRQAKTPKEKAMSIKNAIILTSLIVGLNGAADVAKDVLLGRKIDLKDTFVDNLLKLAFLSRYQLDKGNRGDITSIVTSNFAIPQLDWINNAYKDYQKTKKAIEKGDDIGETVKNYKSWKNVPVVGKYYYNYIGKGADYRRKDRESEYKTRLVESVKNNDKETSKKMIKELTGKNYKYTNDEVKKVLKNGLDTKKKIPSKYGNKFERGFRDNNDELVKKTVKEMIAAGYTNEEIKSVMRPKFKKYHK